MNLSRICSMAMVSFALSISPVAKAGIIEVDLAGFEAWEFYQDFPGGPNSGALINIGAGSEITSIEYIDLTFTAFSPSWGSEFVLSVNDLVTGVFWDWRPVGTNAPGTFGPLNGSFGDPGLFGSGPFVSTDGNLWVTIYDTFDDPGIDARVAQGTLRISFTPIPEPSSLLLLGLSSVALVVRRRR
jgi:hypothetical protein